MNLGINVRIGIWVDDLRLGVRGGLKHAEALACEAVGIDAFTKDLNPQTLSQTGRRELAHKCRAAGVTLAALRADVGGRRLAEAQSVDVALGRLRASFDLARDLGAARVVVPLGFVPPAADKGRERATLTEAAKVLAQWGSQTGVRPALLGGAEPPDDLAQFLDGIDSAGFLELDLNPGGYLMRGVQPLDALNRLSKRVALASSSDAYRGGGEAAFSHGDVPWGEVLVGLSALARNEPLAMLCGCTRECDRVQALGAAVAGLKKRRLNPLAR